MTFHVLYARKSKNSIPCMSSNSVHCSSFTLECTVHGLDLNSYLDT